MIADASLTNLYLTVSPLRLKLLGFDKNEISSKLLLDSALSDSTLDLASQSLPSRSDTHLIDSRSSLASSQATTMHSDIPR